MQTVPFNQAAGRQRRAATASSTPSVHHLHDAEYDTWMAAIHSRVERLMADPQHNVLVRTVQRNRNDLFTDYLHSFPSKTVSQYHDCATCRGFFNRYGGLCWAMPDGGRKSVLWDPDDAPPLYRAAAASLQHAVLSQPIRGPFVPAEVTLGEPVTMAEGGEPFTHFSLVMPQSLVHTRKDLTAGQVMAAKEQDIATLRRTLVRFSATLVNHVVGMLKAGGFDRPEAFLPAAEFLSKLHADAAAASTTKLARAVALAPDGWLHTTSGALGALLEDFAGRKYTLQQMQTRHAQRVAPLQYRRAQVAPSAGNIAAAQNLVAKLGVERSLHRRFARLEELRVVWADRSLAASPAPAPGVFSHLTPKGVAAGPIHANVNAGAITWAKFERDVLPSVEAMEVLIPAEGPFAAFTTAVHSDAPPILQWDRAEQRNTVAMYTYPHNNTCSRWGLRPGTWKRVLAASPAPWTWFDPQPDHFGKHVTLVVEGAKDASYTGPSPATHNCLFAQTLRSELHPARSTIEAFSNSQTIHGGDNQVAGLRVGAGVPVSVRVRLQGGAAAAYVLDRME